MRKMTKTAVTLAAMSAMTIASASMAFATNQREQLNAIGGPEEAANPNSGEWEGNDVNGWTFTPTGESQLRDTWAEIDGIWYYFHKDGIMAQNELIYLQGETYYFTPAGAMAVGWYEFDRDSDVLYDYGLDIQENINDIRNPVFETPADAYETVWLFFNTNGKAVDDEWYQADSGLWYYFDDIVMACGDYDHEIGNYRYGFGQDGHMYVGWEANYNDLMRTAPNRDLTAWYWYDSNGRKFDATRNDGYAWKQITDENGTNWYCFYSNATGRLGGSSYGYENNEGSVGTLIMNAYFANNATATGNSDYYYVDTKGIMAKGVVTVPSGAKFVNATAAVSGGFDWASTETVRLAWEVAFANDGKARNGAWVDNKRYYAKLGSDVDNDANVYSYSVNRVNSQDSFSVTGYRPYYDNDTNNTRVRRLRGALVKSAFIYSNDHYYYVDSDGDRVTTSVVEVGNITVAGPEADRVYTFASDKAVRTTGTDDLEYRAYALLNARGEAYTDVAVGTTVRIGSRRYIATDKYLPDVYNNGNQIQIFYYENWN